MLRSRGSSKVKWQQINYTCLKKNLLLHVKKAVIDLLAHATGKGFSFAQASKNSGMEKNVSRKFEIN